jgi:hypothetical protein
MNNDKSQGEDVSQTTDTVETDTTDTSSSENKTDQVAEESASTTDTKGTDSKYVPYERFSEVNNKAKELEDKIRQLESRFDKPEVDVDPKQEQIRESLKQIAPVLKELGFVSRDELAQQEEDKQVQAELSALEKQYDGSDGRPKFVREDVVKYAIENKIGSVEAAYKLLHEKNLIDWQIARATQKSKGVKTESSDGSGSSEVGTTNDDLKEAIKEGNKSALHTFLKRQITKS